MIIITPPYAIGWISSHLLPRTTPQIKDSKGMELNRRKKMIHDIDGYRLIYGKFPFPKVTSESMAIINNRLYCTYRYYRHFNDDELKKYQLISRDVSDLLASALSSTVPISSKAEADSLINWRLDHTQPFEFLFHCYCFGLPL
jgi:hypothetical protein